MGCGIIVKPTGDRDRYNLSVANISDLVNIVIPLFEKHPLDGAKHRDFLDFCKGVYELFFFFFRFQNKIIRLYIYICQWGSP